MQGFTKTTLLTLARKLDIAKAIFCLNSLGNENVDSEFHEVLDTILQSVLTLKEADLAAEADAFQSALEKVIARMGVDAYIRSVAGRKQMTRQHSSLLLRSVQTRELVVFEDTEGLLQLARTENLDNDTISWLTLYALRISGTPLDLLRPIVRRWADDDMNTRSELAAAVSRLIQHAEGRVRILELLQQRRDDETPGALLLLGQTGDPKYALQIGPYIQDFGAWERLSRAVLTPQRLEAMLGAAHESELSQVLRESTIAGDSRTRAAVLAREPQFHRAVARLVSTTSPLALAASLVDSEVASGLRAFVSDVGAPTRVAAARSLAMLKHDSAIPFLRSGLLDRSSKVREACQAALLEQLGRERYGEICDELKEQTTSLQARLKGMSDWAGTTLADFQAYLSGAASAVQTSTSFVTAKVWTLFDRKVEEKL